VLGSGQRGSESVKASPRKRVTVPKYIIGRLIPQAYSTSRGSGGKPKPYRVGYRVQGNSTSRGSGGKPKRPAQVHLPSCDSTSRGSGGKPKRATDR
jgi:hypothetical protein